MKLIVKTPTFPEAIEFNFDELKQEIEAKASYYINLVYTADQIQEAKKDVAALRKFTKAISDERIKVKKECLKPYEDFEAKIKILDGIVNQAIQNVDGQVKAAEEKDKAEKLEKIKAEFDKRCESTWLTFEKIFNEKWLNASVSMKTVCAEIEARLKQITNDLATLSNLPEFAFEAVEEYKQSLDINKAITEGHRLSEIQKRKAEAQRKMDESVEALKSSATNAAETIAEALNVAYEAQQKKHWVMFKAHLSVDDAQALNAFFKARNVVFEKI